MRACRSVLVALVVALALVIPPSTAALACDGIALDDGCLFTITGGDTPDPDDGFAVTNADGVPLWDFVRERDLNAIGYPISQRWVNGPFTLQAFQKVILQWDPGKSRMNYYNTLDVLANRYPEVKLPNVPPHQVLDADRGATFGTIIQNHLALLDQNEAIKERFLSEPDWLNLYGLPIRYEEREVNGNPQGLQLLRAQRTVFVIWNVPAPGTTVGRVNLQNVPDKVKKLSNVIIPDPAKTPVPKEGSGAPPTSAIPTIGELAQQDTFLQGIVRSLPWLATYAFPWVADGLQGEESTLLSWLGVIGREHQRLATFIADADWFANYRDYATPNSPDPSREIFALQQLHRISKQNPGFIDLLLTYHWLTDDFKFYEYVIISYLPNWIEQDLQLTLQVSGSPWIVDGPTRQEFIAIESLFRLNQTHPELAAQLFGYTLESPMSDVNIHLIAKVEDFVHNKPEQWQKITNQPWYADGLSFNERALITGLLSHWPDFDSQLARPYVQSRTTTLPRTGDVHLWAFQARPFPGGEDVLHMLDEALHGVEQLLGLPLPTDTIIVRGRVISHPRPPSRYRLISSSPPGSFIQIYRYNNALIDSNSQRDRRSVYSLAAALYFRGLGPVYNDLSSPDWLNDGGEAFAASYIDDYFGHQSLENRLDDVSRLAQHDCLSQGVPNLHHLTIPLNLGPDAGSDHPDRVRWNLCLEVLGEYLLLRLFLGMGEAGFSAALREMHVQKYEFDRGRNAAGLPYPSDIEAFQTFLKHAPADRHDAVRNAFREVHGPFTADPSFTP